jgi:diaminohydroxyphosphoribosylaminopyrimidine deaminase/5-amino-6-(5-phosphoribosylamino)uracil reductase
VRVLPVSSDVDIDAHTILRTLAAEGISSVLLEGGALTVNAFITGFDADSLFLFIAPKILGGGLNGFVLNPPKHLDHPIGLTIKKVSLVGKDILLEATYHHT